MASVIVRRGPRAGRLILTVSDAATGGALAGTVQVWRRGNRNEGLQVAVPSNHELLVPPETELGLEVRAPGYETWTYPGDAKPDQPTLAIQSGGSQQISIKLHSQ